MCRPKFNEIEGEIIVLRSMLCMLCDEKKFHLQ
jgi:hypothetical protein